MNKWTKEEFEDAVVKSKSIKEVFLRLGNSTTGYNTFHRYKKLYKIDTSHLCGQILAGKNQKGRVHQRPLSEILIKDGTSLKIRLIKEGLLENKCKICGIDSWDGKPLTLQLDHINGDHWDHRIENLRILCPNCHTQTDTYANKKGSNKKPLRRVNAVVI